MSPAGREVTITIDGREVSAVEGEMLHDAARKGDVEIPYFCYEPKLGDPVGACRMSLVEIEGIPKLQTSCSTPVRRPAPTSTGRQNERSVVEIASSICGRGIPRSARLGPRRSSSIAGASGSDS